MLDYQRPSLPDLVFHDQQGAVITYGRRWMEQGGDGPDDTYSVTAHPERFAPLVEVARAIVEHLNAAYDVSRSDLNEVDDVTRVRLVPSVPNAAPLEFTFGPSPTVYVTAGIATSIGRFCDCDHCDGDVRLLVEGLEQEISAVIDGGLREWLNDPEQGYEGDDLFLAHELSSADGEVDSAGSSRESREARHRLREQFVDVPPGWAPWPRR